jgi:ketosteroid isomerase-like protein
MTDTQTLESQTAESEAIVRRIYDDIVSHDVDGFLSLMGDDIEVFTAPSMPAPWGGVHHGPKEFRENVFAAAARALDTSQMKVLELFGKGADVFATVEVGVVGADRTMIVGEKWTIRDGKAVHLRVYFHEPRIVEEQLRKRGEL